MKASVKWISDELFLGTSESGHSIILDGNDAKLAPCPLEAVLISLGSCSSVDVVSILKKAKQNIKGCNVEIHGTRVDDVPKLFSKIHLHFIISGVDIKEKHVERAVNFSADKYCSVALMLNGKVEISHDFSIITE
jgi:putative redox protein